MKKMIAIQIAMLALGILTGCQKKQAEAPPQPPAVVETRKPVEEQKQAPEAGNPVAAQEKYLTVIPAGVKTLVESGAILIDVRQPEELTGELGAIPGVINIPLGDLQSRVGELDKEKTYVMVCRSGRRSSQAADFLARSGFRHIYNMEGGMNEYRKTVASGQ